MRFRLPPWLVLLPLAMVCLCALAIVMWLRSARYSVGQLFERLPTDGSVVVYIDLEALRRTGVLDLFNGTDFVREPEYRAFVEGTGFDYLRDLDAVLISFHGTGTYFALQGRFDWKSLANYVVEQGGECRNLFCRATGSKENRRISFFPLRPDLMALAVSDDSFAASVMLSRRHTQKPTLPSRPVWAMVPSVWFKDTDRWPAGTPMFARALAGADTVVLSAAPEQDEFELRLDAVCRSAADAGALTGRLRKTTDLLRNLIALEHREPNQTDLSGLLTEGVFEQRDRQVVGRWPVHRVFLKTLAGRGL